MPSFLFFAKNPPFPRLPSPIDPLSNNFSRSKIGLVKIHRPLTKCAFRHVEKKNGMFDDDSGEFCTEKRKMVPFSKRDRGNRNGRGKTEGCQKTDGTTVLILDVKKKATNPMKTTKTMNHTLAHESKIFVFLIRVHITIAAVLLYCPLFPLPRPFRKAGPLRVKVNI